MKKKVKSFFTKLFIAVFVIALVGLCLYILRDYIGLKFSAGEVLTSKSEISTQMVREQLAPIGELVTYSYEYDGVSEIEDTRQVLGVNIPGTTHRITIQYSGIIKVGYTVSDIEISVDNDANIIYIRLPAPVVTDNYIDEESMVCTQDNNIFNPIGSDEVSGRVAEIKDEELKKAEIAGIYTLARDNAQELIRGLLSAFSDYTVVFE